MLLSCKKKKKKKFSNFLILHYHSKSVLKETSIGTTRYSHKKNSNLTCEYLIDYCWHYYLKQSYFHMLIICNVHCHNNFIKRFFQIWQDILLMSCCWGKTSLLLSKLSSHCSGGSVLNLDKLYNIFGKRVPKFNWKEIVETLISYNR